MGSLHVPAISAQRRGDLPLGSPRGVRVPVGSGAAGSLETEIRFQASQRQNRQQESNSPKYRIITLFSGGDPLIGA